MDLDQADPDPDRLATRNEQVVQLAVDAERLYWVGLGDQGSQIATVHSCEKRSCAASQIDYPASTYGSIASFGVEGGQVYWFRELESGGLLVACAAAGCKGEPRVVSQLQNWDEKALNEAVFDEQFVYFFGQRADSPTAELDILRTPLSGQGTPGERIATSDSVVSLAVHDEYLYWLGSDQYRGGASTNLGFVARVRKDGSGAPERLASNLELAPSRQRQGSAHLGLAVDDSYFYWSRSALLGAIFRCPLTGCAGAPEKVASPVRFPLGLLLDGSNLYWAYRSDASSYAIATCTSSACQPTLGIVRGSTAANALAADEDYLYTATTETGFDDYDQWTNLVSTIRRFPK